MNKKLILKIISMLIVSVLLASGCGADENQQFSEIPRPDIQVFEQTENDLAKAELERIAEEESAFSNAAPAHNSYNVTIEVNPAQRRATAVEKISYKNQTGDVLDRIYLKFNINAFSEDYEPQPFFNNFSSKVFKYGKSYSDYSINSITINSENIDYSVKGRSISIKPAQPLKPDDTVEITMQFECTIPKIGHRIGSNDDALWFGNFIPLVAAYVDGEFVLDEYYPAGDPFVSEVSNFDVAVTTPKDYMVYGTGLEKITENETNKTTRMTINMVRDFAFAVSNKFRTETITTNDGIPIYFHHYSSDIKRMDRLIEVAKETADFMTEKVGDFPYKGIDIIETDMFIAGGMEFPCVVFVDSAYLKSTADFKSVGHEIIHQWFYNVVGSNQIKEAWLDEGLTIYLQERILKSSNEIDDEMGALYDDLRETFKASEHITLSDNLSVYGSWREYTDVHYDRASLMFHALYKKLGEVKFYEALKTYYSDNSFKLATKQSLIDSASKVYGESLEDFFDSWIMWKEFPNI